MTKQNQENDKAPELNNTDILFECEYCGKSLTIDYRGAGLSIQCPDCHKEIQVPIPEGIDLADIDQGLENTQAHRNAMAETVTISEKTDATESTEQIRTLMTELEELRFRTRYLEKEHSRRAEWLKSINKQLVTIRTALSEIDDIFNNLTEQSSDDTQELL